MDCAKAGRLIRTLRLEKALTQRQLADQLHLSDKTVSKWERGQGYPDVALLPLLSRLLGVNIEEMLDGDLSPGDFVGGNMKHTSYYVCPTCGNLTLCTGGASVSCCGRRLEALTPQKATAAQKLTVEAVEDEWYITADHPMEKDNYISFVAFATGDRVELRKQYPQWDLQLRLPQRGHGTLLWYDTRLGLFYQLL